MPGKRYNQKPARPPPRSEIAALHSPISFGKRFDLNGVSVVFFANQSAKTNRNGNIICNIVL